MVGHSSLGQVCGLASVALCTIEFSPKTIESLLRPRIALVRCTTVPPDGFHAIRLHAPTVLVHPAEAPLCVGLSLLGRAPDPADGRPDILRHTTAVAVHVAEVVLCAGVSLLGRTTEQ